MKKFSLLVALVLVCSMILGTNTQKASSDTDCDWPMFGRTLLGSFLAPDNCGPTSNSLVMKYSQKLSCSTGTSPTVVDNKIYFGVHLGKFYCFQSQNGSKLWEYNVSCGGSSAAYYNSKIYFGAADGYVYCLNADKGTKIWSFKFIGPVSSTSSPMCYKDFLYIGSYDGYFYCLNALNGRLIWKFKTGSYVTSSPRIFNDKVYFGSHDKYLYCLNIKNGFKIWSFKTGSGITSSPTIQDNKIYFGSPDQTIYCLNATTGKKIWVYKTESYRIYNSSAITGNLLLVPASATDGISIRLYCINTNTGKQIWVLNNVGSTSPVICKGKAYVGGNNTIYCINIQKGKTTWQQSIDYNEPYNGLNTPTISNGCIYINSEDGGFYCFGDK